MNNLRQNLLIFFQYVFVLVCFVLLHSCDSVIDEDHIVPDIPPDVNERVDSPTTNDEIPLEENADDDPVIPETETETEEKEDALPTSPTLIKEQITDNIPVSYGTYVWPVSSQSLSSPFGPRLQASQEYRYDFHPGIDIPGELGSPIGAIADGEVFRTYHEEDPDNPYPESGNVVIIRHTFANPFSFHGKSFTTYYSLYMHLDTISIDDVVSGGPYPDISMGDVIGTMGQSGTTTFTHLHLEVRIGTTCSRNYQINNSTSSCATTFGENPQEPHVNPLLFLSYNNGDTLDASIEKTETSLRITITSDRSELDINEINVSDGTTTKTIQFNDRTGIDPSNVDNNSYDDVTLEPDIFNTSSTQYGITTEFADMAEFDSIEINDIWGNGILFYYQ